MIPASHDVLNALQQPQIELYLNVEVYDYQMTYIDEFSQQVTSDIGSITLNNTSTARRSLSLTFDNTSGKFLFDEEKLIWLDKRFKVFIGVKTKKGVEYIPQGVFVLTQPSNSNTTRGYTTTVELVDKSYLYTDKRGKTVNYYEIAVGTKVTDAIKLVAQGAYETLFNFDNVTTTVPYVLNYNPDTSRWQIMKDLADLAKCQLYFDYNGYLRLKQIDLNQIDNEPYIWEFKNDKMDKFYAGSVRKFSDTILANYIRVLGGSGDTASVLYDLIIDETNPIFADHPYSIQKLGRIVYFHNNGNPDGLITTVDEAKWRAKYELMRRAGYDEVITVNSFPQFLLEPDDVVVIEDEKNGIKRAKYVIQSMTIPISPAQMTMECYRQRRVLSDWNFL